MNDNKIDINMNQIERLPVLALRGLVIFPGLNASFDIESASTFGFDKKRYMYISKGSFEIKEELKENGFFFDSKKKVWKKEFNEKDFYLYRKKWNGIAIFVD